MQLIYLIVIAGLAVGAVPLNNAVAQSSFSVSSGISIYREAIIAMLHHKGPQIAALPARPNRCRAWTYVLRPRPLLAKRCHSKARVQYLLHIRYQGRRSGSDQLKVLKGLLLEDNWCFHNALLIQSHRRTPPRLPLGEHHARQRQKQPLRHAPLCRCQTSPSLSRHLRWQFNRRFVLKTIYERLPIATRWRPRQCPSASSNWLKLKKM